VPLKAIVDGETIIGPDLSEEEWTTLKSRHTKGLTITMGCCRSAGTFKDIKKGNPTLLSRG
jgi:S-methylmethionine-dependent homocysteine/selenocysteine methylase